ncbi:kynurenine formamidase-like [Paramacrobiotus metropolitanus]|uniref:kynurenine formamidase-like n=1 Tax=Paramacrobiotus metropolitanus TaxID=2943436 RepID=UPI002445D068|nr:kynurenine formamidase-like [Paramacrobiotus metropolitanus]
MGKRKISDSANYLYSPCNYNNQDLSPETVLDRHYLVVKEASDEVRRDFFWIENIRYGSTWEDSMDVYSYQQEIIAGRPIFVYVHGVYGLDLCKDVSAFMGRMICENGGVLVVVGHRISNSRPNDQTVSVENACSELSAAMETILQMATRLKSSGILMCGHSWGAHLLGMMLSANYPPLVQKNFHLIKAIWLVGGVYNLKPLTKTYHNGYLQLTNEEITNCSPVSSICVKQLSRNFKASKDTVFNVCVAQFDSPVLNDEAEEYFLALKKRLEKQKGMKVELTQFLGRDHFQVVENLLDPHDGFTQEILASMIPLRPTLKEPGKYAVISLEREILPLSHQGSTSSF